LNAGRLDEILDMRTAHVEILVTGVEGSILDRVPGIQAREALGERFRLQVGERSVGAVAMAVEDAGGRILAVHPVRQSLEDYFLKEMGADGVGAIEVAD
jgi:hypothetical protein